MSHSTDALILKLKRALSRGPQTAAQLIATLGVSQATCSRAVRALGPEVTMFRVPGDRTPRYGLLRQLPLGVSSRQPVYRCSTEGKFIPFADLEFFAGGGTLERSEAGIRFYEGLPPYLLFSAPSGFLGRQLAQEAARSHQLPANLSDWQDDHRVAYLFQLGLNLSGNLIYGLANFQAEMNLSEVPPVAAATKLSHYVEMANALKSASYGSSAGGEQPKFLAYVEDAGHVIVKFAKRGSRMAELLPLEHLALRCLATVDVPSSSTELLTSRDFVFLEVQRFDRVGPIGRVGMLSAGSIDDEFFGGRDTWAEFAARCEAAGYLSSADARHVDTMAAFSELIGNTDTHFENLSLLIDEAGEYLGIAPAYDILPMRYAPLGGGIDPDLSPLTPKIGTIGAKPDVWRRALTAASRFWSEVAVGDANGLIPQAMRRLARENLAVAQSFAAPLAG